MESEIRISTICSRDRAPKQLQCACMFDSPQKHIQRFKKHLFPNNNLNNIWFMQKNKCSRITYLHVVLDLLEFSHCPRNTIDSRKRTQKQLQCAGILDARHKRTTKNQNNKQKQIK